MYWDTVGSVSDREAKLAMIGRFEAQNPGIKVKYEGNGRRGLQD